MRQPAYLFSSICLSLIVSAAQASEAVTTPFTLELSPTSTPRLLSGISSFKSPSGQVQTTLPDIELNTPFAVSISGIHLTLNYAFNTPQAGANLNEWAITSKSISADVIVDEVNASQTITVSEGGVTLNLNVTATCTGVHLQLPPGSTQASASIAIALTNGQLALTLNDFAANWAPSSWQIVSMNCQGPNGFGDLVAQSAQAQLQSINPFLSDIRNDIQAQLNAVGAAGPVSWTLNSSDSSGISMNLTPESLQLLSDGGAELGGIAAFSFAALNGTGCQKQISGDAPVSNGEDSLSIPVSAVEALIQCASLNKSLSYLFSSSQLPAFQSLLGNWFEKLFVWPDLLNFGSKSIFTFDLFPSGPPVFGPITEGASGNMNFNFSAPMTLASYAPEKDGMEHYVDFTTNLSGPATLAINNGVLSFTQSNSQLNISAHWDPLFIQNHNPDQSIWSSIIAGDLKNLIASPGVTYTLPKWSVPGAFSLSIGSAQVDGADMHIGVSVNPNP